MSVLGVYARSRNTGQAVFALTVLARESVVSLRCLVLVLVLLCSAVCQRGADNE